MTDEPMPDLFKLSQSGTPEIVQVVPSVAFTVMVVELLTVPRSSADGETFISDLGAAGSSFSSSPHEENARPMPNIKEIMTGLK